MLMTVASGSSSAVEWYRREYEAVPPELMVLAMGSYKSACLPAGSGLSLLTEPPSARTLPFGRIMAFIWIRPVDMDDAGFQAGVVSERSMISVVAVAGLP